MPKMIELTIKFLLLVVNYLEDYNTYCGYSSTISKGNLSRLELNSKSKQLLQ